MLEVRNRGSKRGLYISTACVGVAILSAFLVSRLGALLMTSDPLRPAQAIVVFGGHLPFRAQLVEHRLEDDVRRRVDGNVLDDLQRRHVVRGRSGVSGMQNGRP